MVTIFCVVFTLSLGLAFAFKLFGISSIFKEKQPLGLPNGSMGFLPFVGESLAYLKPHKSTSLGSFLQEHCSRYGSVFKSHLFGRPTIVSCNIELNTFILRNEETLFRSSYPKPVRDILGELSMMHVSGDHHKKLRSVAVSLINDSIKRPDFIHFVDKLSASFVDSLKGEKQLFLFGRVKELTFFLMVKNMLNMEADDPLARKLLEAFLTFMKGFVSLPLNIPGTAYSKALKARKTILSTFKEIMKKRENMKSGGDSLDQLLANGFSEDQKLSILLDLFLAGYETTSSLMALAVYFLAQAPSSLQTLQDEHQLLRKRKKDGEPLNWQDYKDMKFTSNVMSEALRCGNPVKFLHREALKDVKFKEYTIPAGWQVLPVVLGVHLDPFLHERPSEFNPWRWDDPTTSKNVTPFGGGLRICPGGELGKFMTAFFLHHFVLNLRWKTKEEECPLVYPYLDFKRGLELEIEQLE